MKSVRTFTFIFLCLFQVIGHAADEWYTYTDKKGRTLVASIVKIEETSVLLKLKTNGKNISVNFDSLSDTDVAYLKLAKTEQEAKNTKEGTDVTTEEDISKTTKLYPRDKNEIREVIREIEGQKKPEKISKSVHEATQQLNIFRYLCGLNYDVEPDEEFSKNAEDAAKACEKNGSLSHDLGHSTDKCNLAQGRGMVDSVAMYINDPGENNRERRGHRAWCLNPPMKKVGFGESGNFSAMWCMNSDGKSLSDTWTYPGKGLFPIEYMHGNAWSLYGVEVPNSIDDVSVKIYKLKSRPDKPFSTRAEIPGKEVPVKFVSKAMMNGINFEPETPAEKGIYWVTVSAKTIKEAYLVELY